MGTVARKRFTIAPAVVLVASGMAVALLALVLVYWGAEAESSRQRDTRGCELNLVQYGDSLNKARMQCAR
jgi:hypothetical protein